MEEILLDGLIPFHFLLNLDDAAETDLSLILSFDNLLSDVSDILAHSLYNGLQISYLRRKRLFVTV